MLRIVFAFLAAVAATLSIPAKAQGIPEEYQAAEDVYESIPQELQVEIQVLMTASGYWFAFPADVFSPRFYEALKTFQKANGLKENGFITEPLLEQLFAASRPYLARWGFAEIPLPDRPTKIWVPAGLNLKSEAFPHEILLTDPQGQVEIQIRSVPKKTLKSVYNTSLQEAKKAKVSLKSAQLQESVAMITYTIGNEAGHWQYHSDRYGVIGFNIKWNARNSALAGDRIMLIMGGSLIATIDRFSYARLFSFDSPSARSGDSKASASPDGSSSAKKNESQNISSGTGFFVNTGGHMLTNAHVIEKCREFVATPSGGETMSAKLVAVDETNDLALLKVDTKPFATAAIRTNVKLGEPIAVFGYPLASVLSRNGNFTLGNVTALAGLGDDSNHYQISAPVQPGNSGGPLVDQYGNLVGVIQSKLDALQTAAASGDVPQNVNFAIKASVAINFLTSNGITFTEGRTSGLTPLDPVALAEKTKSISAFILCK